MKRILHIGVAVKDVGMSSQLFAKLFGSGVPQPEIVREQKSQIAFFPIGDSLVELIQATEPGTSIERFIEKRGEGIHHICLEVEGLEAEVERLTKLGFQFVNETPSDGGDGYHVVFLHPKSANGVLIELAEKIVR
ncbi:MAG: methylmalonyl-CoA epimerase [Bacteroidota bacterium]|nr:methylmalonyl-CoA epimerase [Bacteroidota bacterium]